MNAGIAFLEGGRIDDALAYFREGERKNPDFMSRYGYASALYLKHQTEGNVTELVVDEVMHEYKACLSEKPDFADAHLTLGVVCRHKALFTAERYCKNDRDPETYETAIYFLALSRLHLKKAIKLNPSLRLCAEEELREAEKVMQDIWF